MNGTTIFAAMLAVAFAAGAQAGEPVKPESKSPPLAVAPASSYVCEGGVCRARTVTRGPVVNYFAVNQPVRTATRYVVAAPVKVAKRSVYVVRHRVGLINRLRFR